MPNKKAISNLSKPKHKVSCTSSLDETLKFTEELKMAIEDAESVRTIKTSEEEIKQLWEED